VSSAAADNDTRE